MKTKKAQVSIFLIVGLVAIMIVAFLLIMKEDNFTPFRKTSTTPLDTHIKLCEEQATECLLYRLGTTSGKMIFTPGVLPGFGEMEGNARRYAKNTPQECFEFDKFPGQEITINGLTPNLQLNHQNLIVEFVNDIITKEEGQERRAADQMVKVPVRYQAMYDDAVQLRNAQETDVPAAHVPLYNHVFDVQIIEEEKAPLFILTDPETKIRNQFYQFYFTRE